MANRVALIIIYNHKYDKNIPVLEEIYRNRFSDIYHLVPFYTGNKENVIAVYEKSYYFQGYIAQGFKSYFKQEYEHYFFVADDMIVNPAITQTNYKSILKLDDKSSFLPNLDDMPATTWAHDRQAVLYNPYAEGVEVKNELPSIKQAQEAMNKWNVKNDSFSFKDVYFHNKDYRIGNIIKQLIKYSYDRFVLKTDIKKMKYPVARSYSDILVVSGTGIRSFIHYCGIFAATDLWVELAIPTALILSGDNIVTEKNTQLKGKPLWGADVKIELAPFGFQLKKLLDHFPERYIYLHPIKLSQWNCHLT